MIRVMRHPSRIIHDGVLFGMRFVPACDPISDKRWHELPGNYVTSCKRCLRQRTQEIKVGDHVNIVRNQFYSAHYGTVVRIEHTMHGARYHVSGGSLGDSAPVFDKHELAKRI